jgi:anti-sigma-K factor RskA
MAGVQGSAVYLKKDGVTLVEFKSLPALDRDRVYELWLVTDDGKPVPAGVFTPGPDGSKVVVVDRSLKGIKALAVSVEPGPDGSLTPSRAPELAAQVT